MAALKSAGRIVSDVSIVAGWTAFSIMICATHFYKTYKEDSEGT